MQPLLDKAQVARMLNVSTRSVDRLRAAGELRSLRIRGRVRFLPDAVQLFIDAQRRVGRP